MTWTYYRDLHNNLEAAREAFEADCTTLFKSVYSLESARRVKVKNGDDGIDILIGDIGIEPITVIQCKFFIEGFGDSQKGSIRSSFKKAVTSERFSVKEWILCLPRRLTVDEQLWWEKWREKAAPKHSLEKKKIKLYDGDTLIELLKGEGLFERIFKITDKLLLEEIREKVSTFTKDGHPALDMISIQRLFKSASFDLESMTCNFGTADTHVQRTETTAILDWTRRLLQVHEKRVLILEGEKGYGKSIIMKDVLNGLEAEGTMVMAIKADRIYAEDRGQLEKKLFHRDNLSFEDIIGSFRKENRRLVVIIDQLDALSQTLSSKREYLQTYNRLVADLAAEECCRVIISARTFDLTYDAALSIYKGKGYSTVKVSKLTPEQVKKVLAKYGITNYESKLTKLLQIPNHLDIFCKLPNKQFVNYSTLSSLKDLYDNLWSQVIVSQKNPALAKVMYRIAEAMYSMQQITVKNIYRDSEDEITYLISNGLLNEEKGYLQFFHQTFYDYTFARDFVEKGNSLAGYISENRQSLYCRSVIKIVLDYYRDYNEKAYNATLRSLFGRKYRYHIQSLAVSNLAQMEFPTAFEKRCFSALIIKNRYHAENFINSVSSKGWMEFLLERDIPFRLLSPPKENGLQRLINRLRYPLSPKPDSNAPFWIIRLFGANSAHSMDGIVSYTQTRFQEDQYNDMVSRFLTMNEDWSNERLLPVFEKVIPFDIAASKHGNFYYFHALEKISAHHYNYVLQQLKPRLAAICHDQLEMPYELKKLLQKLISDRPEETIGFLMDIFIPLAETPDSYSSKQHTGLYKSLFISDHHSRLLEKSAAVTIRKLIAASFKESEGLRLLVKGYFARLKDSDSKAIVHLLAEMLMPAPEAFHKEIHELLAVLHTKKGLADLDDKMQFTLRKLIAKTFKYFTSSERAAVSRIILAVSHPYEKDIYQNSEGRRYHRLNVYGRKKYLFLDALPTALRDSDPTLKKTHQELFRKFGTISEKYLDDSGMRFGSSAPPLSQSSYDALDEASWIQTMLKYNDDYKEPFDGGGRREHRNSFTEQVAKEPARYRELIGRLFSIEGISHDYCYAGVEGLIKAKCASADILPLYHKLIALPLNTGNTLGAIHQADYFIQDETADQKVIDFLSQSALYHKHPEKILNPDHLFTDAINSVRGAAVYGLARCYFNPLYSDKIFETLEKAAEDPLSIVRIAVLSNLAYLNHLDIDRSFKLFLKLTQTHDLNIINHAFWSAGYFRQKFFDQLRPLILKVITNKELHERGTVFLVHNYLLGYDKNGEDYHMLMCQGKEAKLKAIHVAEENLFSREKPDPKCLGILTQFLDETDEDFIHPYSTFVLRKAKPGNFQVLFPFLAAYTKTHLFALDPAYTIQYLNKVVKNHPLECLTLLKNMDFTSRPDIQKRGFYKDEPIQLVLAIYSYLCASPGIAEKDVDESLRIFDKMLRLEHLKYAANEALDTLQL